MSQISENAVVPWKTNSSKLSSYTGSCTETGPPPKKRMQRLLLDPTLTYQNLFFFSQGLLLNPHMGFIGTLQKSRLRWVKIDPKP